MDVRKILAQDTYALRQQILRPHQDIQACMYPGDDAQDTFHLGSFDGDGDAQQLVSIASFYFECHPELESKTQVRLRGMATQKKFEGKGHGSKLLQEAVSICKSMQAELLWCNARTTAQPFYQKLGFDIFGAVFEIKDIGPHYVMFQKLSDHA